MSKVLIISSNIHQDLAAQQVANCLTIAKQYPHDFQIETVEAGTYEIPFVIKIEGSNPTWVVHADLEFSDEEMARRILSKEPFTEEEIGYMTNARMSEFQPSGPRNCDSYQVVVGHNIIDMPEQPKAATPVRPLTNHINLDAGAYFTNGFLLLNVTDNSVEIVGRNISTENLQLLQYGKETIQAHLSRHSLENEETARPYKRIRFTL